MLSDAGEALACRRRDLTCFSRSFCNLFRFFFHLSIYFYNLPHLSLCFVGGSMHLDNKSFGFPAKPLYHVRTTHWSMSLIKENLSLFNRSPIAKSESCLLNIYRSMPSRTFALLVAHRFYCIPSKSTFSPPYPLTEWSFVLRPDPEMLLTAEGLVLTLPSCHLITFDPYTSGGTITTCASEATLGLSLLGLHFCGPLPLSQPNYKNLMPSPNYSWPRSVYLIPSPSPSIRCCLLHDISSRRLCYFPEATICIWLGEYSPQTLLLNSPLAKGDESESNQRPQPGLEISLFWPPPSRTLIINLGFSIDFGLALHLPVTPRFVLISTLSYFSQTLCRIMYPLLLPRLHYTHLWKFLSWQVEEKLGFSPVDLVSNCDPSPPRHPLSLLDMLGLICLCQTDYKLCVEFFNLHGRRFHVREDPPVMLRLYIYYLSTLVPTSSLRFMPEIQEAKDIFLTSLESLLIVTISKFSDLIGKVSMTTHHEIACGLLLQCFGLQFSMAYPTYLRTYVTSLRLLKCIVPFFMFENLVIFAPERFV